MKLLSIVIAEDVTDIQQLIAGWLESRGHDVRRAGTGNEALKLMRTEDFDLAIVDVLMPDGDGLDVIRELSEKARFTRILAISGGGKYMTAEDCVKLAEGLGAHAALLKPFNEQQLLYAVERALGPFHSAQVPMTGTEPLDAGS